MSAARPAGYGQAPASGDGRLPWTGSAQRTRDIGYAEAMAEIAYLAADLQHGLTDGKDAGLCADRLLPVEALEAIRSYCFDVYAMHAEARMTLTNIGWCAGMKIQRDARAWQDWRDLTGGAS